MEAYISHLQLRDRNDVGPQGLWHQRQEGVDPCRGSLAACHLVSKALHPCSPLAQLEHAQVQMTAQAEQKPYFDFWAWSCRNLEWCGPCPSSERQEQRATTTTPRLCPFSCTTLAARPRPTKPWKFSASSQRAGQWPMLGPAAGTGPLCSAATA